MNGNIIEKMSLSPVEMADELSMMNKDCLLVEGQTDKFFWEHLQREGLKIKQIRVANKKQCSGNKEYVKKVISIMNQRKKHNVIGIVDLDYDFVCEKKDNIPNLYYYKYIDLENVLIQSSSFSELNECISSTNKKLSDEDLKHMLYQKVYILGLLRLLNNKDGYNFCFDGLNYKKLLNNSSDDFLQYFFQKMNLNKTQQEKINLSIDGLKSKNYDGKYICNGHDLLEILSLLTKNVISNDNPIKYTEEIIRNILVVGYKKKETIFDIYDCSNELLI